LADSSRSSAWAAASWRAACLVGGAQGDQLGVLGATRLELLGDRAADLGEQRLDGAQVLDHAADAVQPAVDGLIADADGLGGLDQTVRFRLRTIVLGGQHHRLDAALGVAIALRQQPHLAHPLTIRGNNAHRADSARGRPAESFAHSLTG
jgi:hypothetical protein